VSGGGSPEPLLTIIVCGRNDNFGGDFNARTIAAAAFNHENLEAFSIPHEYVLVEWNPLPDRPYLAEIIRQELPWWHRSYVVDPAWHQHLSVNPRIVFMEFFAKNVGIRRARGRFILTTNTDIWLSRAVLRTLPRLRASILYRAIRMDLRREIGYTGMTFGLLEHPESVLRANVLGRGYYSNASGDFLLLDRHTYQALGGFNEVFREAKIHKDANFCAHVRQHGLPIEVLGQVYHLDHESSWNNIKHLVDVYGPNLEEAHCGRADWDWEAVYENPPDWGLADAPEEARGGDITYLACPAPVPAVPA
jgi:hypothetical protein